MPDREFELGDLQRVLAQSAGTAQDADLDGEVLDTAFEDLGYDSLALMETAAKISQEYGIPIDEDALAQATTPRGLLDLVNASSARQPQAD
jgi:act minimal PKS acyl carrier protein